MKRTAAGCALVALLAVPWTGDAASSRSRAIRGAAVSRAGATGAADSSRASRAQLIAASKLSCGPLATYANARPKNFADSQKTRYDADTDQHVPVTFSSGDSVDFECLPGFSTDGSKDGNRVFQVDCMEQGYYKPSAVCLEASPCGAVPEVANAQPTGHAVANSVEFECSHGFSLDGKNVVPGGLRENQIFKLKCIAFSGSYEEFKGSCRRYTHMPASESIAIYGQVFETLFVVSCKSTLSKAFASGGSAPGGLDSMCGKLAAHQVANCQSLVDQVKSDYETKQAARQEHEEAHKEDGLPIDDQTAPNFDEESKEFCNEVWKLVEMPSGST